MLYCVTEKSLNEFLRLDYALGRARTQETDLYQARGSPDPPPARPHQLFTTKVWTRLLLRGKKPGISFAHSSARLVVAVLVCRSIYSAVMTQLDA